MSQQPVSAACWFGKLPSIGDFVGRRMSHELTTGWDYWLRSGLDQLRSDAPDTWTQRFVHSPIWFFLTPARVTGVPGCGVIAPSVDRVGRFYPLTVMSLATERQQAMADTATLSRFLAGAHAAVVDARRLPLSPDELDARLAELPSPFESRQAAAPAVSPLIANILADLNAASEAVAAGPTVALPSAELRAVLQKGADTSVWWVSPTAQWPFQELSHGGALHRPLFLRLFQGAQR
ncbi:MAG: type VI secretion system-associated protein TagF [Rubrivivax sp.]